MTWAETTVGAEFEVQLGKMLDSERNNGESKLYVGNRAVQWGRIDLAAAGHVPLTKSDQLKFRLRRGDLLVCEGGEVGRGAIWDYDIECYFQKAIHRLRTRRDYRPEVLLGLLELRAKSSGFADYVTQTSIAHLPKDKFLTLPIPSIPAADQERIAAVLASANDLVASLERLIAKKRAIKQGLMQELLTGRTRLPGFSGEWERVLLRDVAIVDPDSLSSATTPAEEVIDYISLEDVSTGSILGSRPYRFSDAPSRARRQLRSGDVLFGTVRPNLQSHARYPGGLRNPVASTGFAVIRSRARTTESSFLAQWVLSTEVMAQIDRIIAGSNYPAVSSTDVRNLELSKPTATEQVAIGEVLQDADAEIEALGRRLEGARDVKQGMMQELLTGRTRLVPSGATA